MTHHPLHHEGKLFTFGSVGSEKQYGCQKPGRGKELRYPSKSWKDKDSHGKFVFQPLVDIIVLCFLEWGRTSHDLEF